ncbi:MAG: YkgJ family cysteine cluster protein [Chthoniobacteraceae bacterium]
MTSSNTESAESHLCATCGMCCNGVLFEIVLLGSNDSAKRLAAAGLKLKHKKRRHYIQQPCPAYKGAQCCIYDERPERCRKFECRQLIAMKKGEITEAQAQEKIRHALARVSQVEQLFRLAGERNSNRPLIKRYDKIMEQPIDASLDPQAAALRAELTRVMEELETLLKNDFRSAPPPVPASIPEAQ